MKYKAVTKFGRRIVTKNGRFMPPDAIVLELNAAQRICDEQLSEIIELKKKLEELRNENAKREG